MKTPDPPERADDHHQREAPEETGRPAAARGVDDDRDDGDAARGKERRDKVFAALREVLGLKR